MRRKYLISEKLIKNIENKYSSYKGILIIMCNWLDDRAAKNASGGVLTWQSRA
jgi:hypothetical protein